MNHDVEDAASQTPKPGLFGDIQGMRLKGFSLKTCCRRFGRCNRLCLPAGRDKTPGERKTNKTAACDKNRPGHPASYNEAFALAKPALFDEPLNGGPARKNIDWTSAVILRHIFADLSPNVSGDRGKSEHIATSGRHAYRC